MKVLYGAVEVDRSRGYAFCFHFCVIHTYYSYHYQSEFYCILEKCFEMRVQCSKINKK
jgi:hypothetical protein